MEDKVTAAVVIGIAVLLLVGLVQWWTSPPSHDQDGCAQVTTQQGVSCE